MTQGAMEAVPGKTTIREVALAAGVGIVVILACAAFIVAPLDLGSIAIDASA